MPKAYRLWLSARFFSNFGKQIQLTAVAWQIFSLTRDPLAVGTIGLAQAIPYVSMALWAGHIVDRNEKRSFIMRAEAGFLLTSAAMVLTTFLFTPPLFLFYAILGFGGLCSSFETVSASAYAQILIPKKDFSRAMGWNLGLFQSALVLGPLTSGWLLNHLPARYVYLIGAACILTALFSASRLPPIYTQPVAGETESGVERVKLGLRFIWRQPLMLAVMSLDMVAVMFGDVVALYPFFADKLNAGVIGFGLLRSSPGIGAATISAIQAARPFVRPNWTTLRTVVCVFGLCILGFALSPNIYLAALFLAIGGAADGTSVIIRQTIYQALTPDHLRGRVASVSSIFIMTSNEIGAFESGLVARLIGVVPSAVVGGFICLSSVAAMSRIFREKIKEI